ncbi:hypothetical protein [Paraburkholderia phenoliruptrix]|uniref:hypothetical protein n=1 Tax=Paraburkholderia phenoliruptrix TaxID=252970 RepID=UPI0034CFF3FC
MEIAKVIEDLRAAAKQEGGDGAAMVLALIDAYEGQQRAEGFWSVRAPAMNDELVIIRQIETDARAVVGLIDQLTQRRATLAAALGELDALRAKQAGA